VKAGIGKWAEIGGSGQTGGGETAGGGGSGGQTGGGQATGGGTTGGGAGGGQAGGGGGGPPPEPPPNDGCLGEPVALSPGLTVEINGTLVGAADDLTTFCADVSTGPGNPDVVYQLDVAADVSLRMRVVATEFDPALSLRLLTCEVESSGDACLNFGNGAEATGVSLAAGTYWVVIDSADGNAGEFVLELAATTPVCGDGILNPGEQCDKGPGIPDDGCRDPGMDAECTFGEEPGSTAQTACPGLGPVEVKMSADPLNPHIQRLGPFYNGTGGNVQTNATTEDLYVCGWAAQGPENVFHVVPESSGTLFARIGYDDNGAVICDLDPSCGDFILYMRQTSCDAQVPEDPLQQLACVDFDDGFQEILVIQAPVTGGSDYWVFVDGLDTTYGLGLFHLELWLVP
jgi:cysteine-rich repeat protein